MTGGFQYAVLVFVCLFGIGLCYPVNDTLLNGQPEVNWGGRVHFGAQSFRQPKTEEEIIEIVKEVGKRGGKIRMIGSGHSHTEVAVTYDTMINLDYYQGLVERDGFSVTFRAGTRIFNINRILKDMNLALPVLGWSAEFAIAGVMQMGTHGTNMKYGNIASTIEKYRLILANGTVVTSSATENKDLFLARLNLGTLGIVSTVTIRTVPLFKLASFHNATDYPTLVSQMKTLPYTTQDTAWVEWYWTAFEPESQEVKSLTYWRPKTDAPVTGCDLPDSYDGPEGCVDWSFNVFNEEDPFRYMEMEVFIPQEVSVEVLTEFTDWQRALARTLNLTDPKVRARLASTFTGVRYMKGDDMWLSPAHGRDTAVVSHFQYVNSPSDYPHFALHIDKLEKMTRKYGGRPHWGKLHFLTASELAPLYPKWGDFLRLREQLDPTDMFLSPYVSHLLYPHYPPAAPQPPTPAPTPAPTAQCSGQTINLNFGGMLNRL